MNEKITIEEVNLWLEEKASSYKADMFSLSEYYRSLKDFDKLDQFVISSVDCFYGHDFVLANSNGEMVKIEKFPVLRYIEENNLNYKMIGFTGGCTFVK